MIAPKAAGVYPFVCTYPGHWRRMYGALYVVDDLDGYLADPEKYVATAGIVPRDALLKDRRPRTEWTFADLVGPRRRDVAARGPELRQRETDFHRRQLHRLSSSARGGKHLRPGSHEARSQVEAGRHSERDPHPFGTHQREVPNECVRDLGSGKVVTGLVLEETPEAIKVIENPLAKAEPTMIRRSDVVDRQRSKTSHDAQGTAGQADPRRNSRPDRLRRGRRSHPGASRASQGTSARRSIRTQPPIREAHKGIRRSDVASNAWISANSPFRSVRRVRNQDDRHFLVHGG